jgi:hypothetical protein
MLDVALGGARALDQSGDLGGGLCGLVVGEDSFLLTHSKLPVRAETAAVNSHSLCRQPLAKLPAKCQLRAIAS